MNTKNLTLVGATLMLLAAAPAFAASMDTGTDLNGAPQTVQMHRQVYASTNGSLNTAPNSVSAQDSSTAPQWSRVPAVDPANTALDGQGG